MRINSIVSDHYNCARLLAPEPRPYMLQTVSKAFGLKWVNDSFSQNANRLWYSLTEICGSLVLILHSSIQLTPEQRFLIGELLTAKCTAIITIGETIEAHTLADFVHLVVKAQSIEQSILLAKRIAVQGQTILYCPAVYAQATCFSDYESRGLEFTRQLNRIT